MFSFTNTVSAVPEPETLALMLTGVGMVGAVARRRRTAKAA
ncbi:MAG TPA: PEPxxWA-CTERM sorting domain-containing protein [Rhodoferax sp.]|nr:PEPxxWA-CTERM sorting domain-containing protein [Rhodoferax sp.]